MIPTKVLNIAHRGARSVAPENTLLSAQKGWELGADLWELDIAMTSDQDIVVIHDDTLTRTSNAAEIFPNRAPYEVHTFSLAELKSLDFGSWYLKADPFGQIAAGNISKEDQETYKNARIPTLREALEFTKSHQWSVNVEIKDLTGKPGDSVIVEKTVALISELQMENRVIISSFNHSYLERVKKTGAQIATAALVSTPAPDPIQLLDRLGAKAYNPSLKAENAATFAALRAAGKEINVWTVNDEVTMTRLINMGVTGIITDFPQRLKVILTSR